jgi:hypothetical protein
MVQRTLQMHWLRSLLGNRDDTCFQEFCDERIHFPLQVYGSSTGTADIRPEAFLSTESVQSAGTVEYPWYCPVIGHNDLLILCVTWAHFVHTAKMTIRMTKSVTPIEMKDWCPSSCLTFSAILRQLLYDTNLERKNTQSPAKATNGATVIYGV